MTPEQLEALAKQCGAIHYSPPPMRGVRGWSFTHDQLAAFADALAAQPAAEPTGLPVAQEPKYTVTGAHIVNRASGEAIPHDEPVFIFRARDVHSREALEAYACVLTPGEHRDAVVQRVADFAAFAQRHPGRMKEPDTHAVAAQPARAGGDAPAVDGGDIEKGRAHARYILELLKRTDWGQHSAAGASTEWEEATCCESMKLLAAAALAAAPQPASPTLVTEDQASKWAWSQVREEVGTEGWTTGDSCTFFGFFMHGWRYRGQYELQRRAALAMAVPVEQPAAAEPAPGMTAVIHENEPDFVHATLTAPRPTEYTLEATREEDKDWYITVTAENGMRDYMGYWKESAHKTVAEVLVEAARGAGLGSLTPPTPVEQPAAVERQPLTDEALKRRGDDCLLLESGWTRTVGVRTAFEIGFRDAERAHGIGSSKEGGAR